MKSTLYGTFRTVEFNPNNIVYILEEGFKCETHFTNSRTLPLSWRDVKPLFKHLPRVYSYDLGGGVYINPKEIDYYEQGVFVDITFKNGTQLKELSRTDFDHNVTPILNKSIKNDLTL